MAATTLHPAPEHLRSAAGFAASLRAKSNAKP
jgi:hypothetical protein